MPVSKTARPLPASSARCTAPFRSVTTIGRSSSLAGKERRNAAKITPLMPKNAPTGSKAAATWARTEAPPTSQCSSTQMTIPAGAAK